MTGKLSAIVLVVALLECNGEAGSFHQAEHFCRELDRKGLDLIHGAGTRGVLCGELFLASGPGIPAYQSCNGRIGLSTDPRDRELRELTGYHVACVQVEAVASEDGMPMHRLLAVDMSLRKFSEDFALYKRP